jgi:hypothetical protein
MSMYLEKYLGSLFYMVSICVRDGCEIGELDASTIQLEQLPQEYCLEILSQCGISHKLD